MTDIITETPVLQQLLTHLQQMTDAERAETRVLLGMDKPRVVSPAEAGHKPDAEDFRVGVYGIDYDSCLGRKWKAWDTRWTINLMLEQQCSNAPKDGCDLCAECQARLDKYAAKPAPGRWNGLITEEPLGWQHMLGTEWAESSIERGKLKWTGIGPNPFSA